jgi:uncharacterized protein
VFGPGTAPAMVGLAWASGRGGSWLTAHRRRAAGWLLVLFGAWTAATPLMHMAGRHGHEEAHPPGCHEAHEASVDPQALSPPV